MFRLLSRLLGLLLVVFVLATFPISGNAQSFQIKTDIDQRKILLGDPIEYQLKVAHDKQLDVSWPQLSDSLGSMEVLEYNPADTIDEDDQQVTITQTIKITAFEPGRYILPSQQFQFHQKGDTTLQQVKTDTFRVTVNAMKVDTASSPKPIKDPLGIPYTFKEIAPYIFEVLGVLLLGILIWWLIKKRRQKPSTPKPAKPSKPPYQLAMEQLRALKQENLWQKGEVKEYHDRLTDIVREFLENQYGISALEYTTDQIMENLQYTNISTEQKGQLKEIFELADLAKFAKLQPNAEENERSMEVAMEFLKDVQRQVLAQDSKVSE